MHTEPSGCDGSYALHVRLTQQCDYALRVLLHLAVRPGERISTEDIAEAFQISLNHLQKVVRELGRLGVVATFRGAGGGIELAVDPADVSIGSVVRALEKRDDLVECFDPSTNTCVVAPACAIKGALRSAQDAFLRELDVVSLEDVVRGRRAARLRSLTDTS